MTRAQFFDLYNKLQGVRYHTDNTKFSYFLIKNIKLIESEIVKLNEIIKPPEDFLAFEKERLLVCKNFAKKDENDQPIINNDEFLIENFEEFNKNLEPVKKKFEQVLMQRQSQIDIYNNMLDEELELELVHVGPDDLPSGITSNELEDIYPILA